MSEVIDPNPSDDVAAELARQAAWYDAYIHGRNPVTGEPADAATRLSMARAWANRDLDSGPLYEPEPFVEREPGFLSRIGKALVDLLRRQ